MEKIERLVPDTSVLIEGLVSLKIEKGELKVDEVIIHEAVLAELEHQANVGKSVGFVGLEEIKKIRQLAASGAFDLRFAGRRPSSGEIRYARLGEIDSLIRVLAWEEDATLLTADKVQARVSEARGVKVLFVPKEKGLRELRLETFFDKETMSIHLREGMRAMAKKGKPGAWRFVPVKKALLEADEIKAMAREIIEEARLRSDGFIEAEREGSTIVQLGRYRIVITRPPFSDGWEITAVRPVKKLQLKDYALSEKLMKRIAEQAEGILLAGAPGHGKTTFAQALAEFYAAKKRIVKTVEAPRDLVLPDSITQYSIKKGSAAEIHDVLLLSRPDYTIFDEMRNTADFKLFADMRLAGVGMVGVVHATTPVDAIQRFIGRIELGVIPHIIDTVIFIKDGKIDRVLSIGMEVKVPSGMTEADLARPTVVVRDFETGSLVAEIYSYGEETVVVPITGKVRSPVYQLASKALSLSLQRYSPEVEVDVVSDSKAIIKIPEKRIAALIGKQGRNIEKLEKRFGMSFEVRALEEERQRPGRQLAFEMRQTSKYFEPYVGKRYAGKSVDVYCGDDYVVTANVSKKGSIRLKKSGAAGKRIKEAIKYKEKIAIYLG